MLAVISLSAVSASSCFSASLTLCSAAFFVRSATRFLASVSLATPAYKKQNVFFIYSTYYKAILQCNEKKIRWDDSLLAGRSRVCAILSPKYCQVSIGAKKAKNWPYDSSNNWHFIALFSFIYKTQRHYCKFNWVNYSTKTTTSDMKVQLNWEEKTMEFCSHDKWNLKLFCPPGWAALPVAERCINKRTCKCCCRLTTPSRLPLKMAL